MQGLHLGDKQQQQKDETDNSVVEEEKYTCIQMDVGGVREQERERQAKMAWNQGCPGPLELGWSGKVISELVYISDFTPFLVLYCWISAAALFPF